MYLIINLKSGKIYPIAHNQTNTLIEWNIDKNEDEIINADYLLDHLDISEILRKHFIWNWDYYDPDKELKVDIKPIKKAKIDYGRKFDSPASGKSKIIMLGKQGIIKIVKRETSPSKEITSRFGVCVNDNLAKQFFNDCKQSYMYKDYGKYEIGKKDECLWNKWENIIKEQYENQYKFVHSKELEGND